MKMKFNLNVLLLISVIFLSCNFISCKDKEEDPILILDPVSTVILKSRQDTAMIKVTTNKDFKATVTSGSDWCNIIVKGKEIQVIGEANPEIEPREASINVVAASLTKNITVKQIATNISQIVVNPDNVNVNSVGDAITVSYVISDGDNVILPKDKFDGWCLITKDEENDSKLVIKADENLSPIVRLAKIPVEAGFGKGLASDTLYVTQEGAEPAKITYNPASPILDSKGTEIIVTVTSNMGDFTFKSPEGEDDWCKVVREGDKLKISASENESYKLGRKAKIAFETGNKFNYLKDTLIVNQQRKVRVYKLWDTYYYNDKPTGIVIEVSEGGKHGYIMSIDEFYERSTPVKAEDLDKHMFMLYNNNEKGPLGLTSEDNSITNLEAAKSLDPTLDKFPAMKWAENKNVDGESGWCIPSLKELDIIFKSVFGCHSMHYEQVPVDSRKNPNFSAVNADQFVDRISVIEGADKFILGNGFCCYGTSTENIAKDPESDKDEILGTHFWGIVFTKEFAAGLKLPNSWVGQSKRDWQSYIDDGAYTAEGLLDWMKSDNQVCRYRAIKKF